MVLSNCGTDLMCQNIFSEKNDNIPKKKKKLVLGASSLSLVMQNSSAEMEILH